MRIKLKVAKCATKTGAVLGKLLEGLGHEVNIPEPEAVVCYGVGDQSELKGINKNLPPNKAFELGVLWRAKVKVPGSSENDEDLSYPFLGRSFKHSRGLDIKLYRNQHDLVLKGFCDYYVELIPSETEFRTWIFRDHHLGTYEKVKVREPERKYRHNFGRSYRLGYAFQLVRKEALHPEVVEIAKAAVKALELDFGAVDILWGDGKATVLEVNTAPGVEGEGRQAIQKLAENISRWLGRNQK